MRVARVFPVRTSYTPVDVDAFVGMPYLDTPKYDEVHISCTFTWDKEQCEFLKKQWQDYAPVVKVGGCAYGSYSGDFISGMYVKKGVTFTTRGCPNNCSFCLVPKREGKLRELPIVEGNIIQDNNILAASKEHLSKVFKMLETQKDIKFKGGLETRRITHGIAYELSRLKITNLWLACDTDGALKDIKKAVEILRRYGFKRDKLYCYSLVGDDIEKNEMRNREIWNIGCIPFAQLYQPAEKKIEYSNAFKRFVRAWSKPAIIRTRAKYNWIDWY